MILNKRAHLILSMLYHLRCLSFNQIYEYIFKSQDLSEKSCSNSLSLLLNRNYVEKVGYFKDNSYYTIRSEGINLLKKTGIFPLHQNKWDKCTFQDVLPAKKILINNNVAEHQLALNQFVLDTIMKYPNTIKEYYDERHISEVFTNIRPDGILKTETTIYFLEMDMNTERKSRLVQKWESYREFIHSESFYKYMTYDIKVLFILDHISEKSRRKNQLREYIDTNLRSEIKDGFNFYIGSREEIYNTFDSFVNPDDSHLLYFYEKEYKTSKGVKGVFENSNLDDISFQNYIYKNTTDNKLVVENGITMDFVIDDYRDQSMYVLKKLAMFPKISSVFQNAKGYPLKYIIITNTEKEAYELLNDTDGYYDGVYFTTIDRLNKYTFNSALFKIERNNILYHFAEDDLRVKQEEQYINAYF